MRHRHALVILAVFGAAAAFNATYGVIIGDMKCYYGNCGTISMRCHGTGLEPALRPCTWCYGDRVASVCGFAADEYCPSAAGNSIRCGDRVLGGECNKGRCTGGMLTTQTCLMFGCQNGVPVPIP